MGRGAAPSRVGDAGAQPPVRGSGLLGAIERALGAVDRAVRALVPDRVNPLIQPGAVANVCLLIAIASGALLLFWYVPSVAEAHASLEVIRGLSLGQVLRSIHRYSSDACMLFVLLHALQALARRQVAGPRKLAWVTGASLLGMLWMVGWLGYWLVWDQPAQQLALGTARALDVLPIISEPVSRPFLTDGTVSTQLFFVVFFTHMLLPLAMAVALWLHISRLSRPRFLTDRRMAWWIVGSLLVLSIVAPATSAAAAHMTVQPQTFSMDWWYLAPLFLTDRLGGGALWAVFLIGGLVAVGLPWLLLRRGRSGARRAVVAAVEVASCNDCRRCVTDCPYAAIQMVPRTDGRRFAAQAEVDPSRCVGCGVCVGSCDSAGIGLDWITSLDQRQRMDAWLREDGDPPFIAFLCAESAARAFDVDAATGRCPALPGYRVVAVPCAGWVHGLTVERALRRGAAGVLVVGCPPSVCNYREGSQFTGLRLAGHREPALRAEKVDSDRVRYVEIERGAGGRARLVEEARSLRGALAPASPPRARPRAAGGLLVLGALLAMTWVPSVLPYGTGASDTPRLVASFKHAGAASETCREATPEELADKPVHMRQPTICERRRAVVHMEVVVDGAVVASGAHAPSGLFGDGSSVAIERLDVAPGTHTVRITIDDGARRHQDQRAVEFTPGHDRVVLFDRSRGFEWH